MFWHVVHHSLFAPPFKLWYRLFDSNGSIAIHRRWSLNKKAAMSWWPDPGLSCVLCWRKSFVQKSWTANIDANAKISNGGDKACETKNKRDRWHCLIRFELGFERNPPIWSWLLEEMLGFFNSWLLLLRAASGQKCCCYRYHHDLDLYKLKLNPTFPHIERMLKRWKVVKRFFNKNALVPLTAPVATPW